MKTRRAFTLIEVVASMLILGVIFGSVLLSFDRGTDAAVVQSVRERAVAVAQRRIETLLATRLEPNSTPQHGQDEVDELFSWTLNLSRESVTSTPPKSDLSNTVIKAVITVYCDSLADAGFGQVELVRYLESLTPMPGREIAVPITGDDEGLLWYADLRERLGREPTLDETLGEMVRLGQISPDVLEELKMVDELLADANEAAGGLFDEAEQFEQLEGFDQLEQLLPEGQ